ncbi:glycosyltransferase [Demequina aurantiaca]|uniref:glycosyltransferase family 2 protein n=1 Tax=Demequina aurantiaca TaxID=676200 RepID=UPI003D3418F8
MENPADPDASPAVAGGAPKTGATQRRRRSTKAKANAAEAPTETSVAALIVAHDQARRIAATVRAARAIPGVDLVLVVDDGSTDNTQDLARKAGAVVVRHSHNRGRTEAIETGASVVAMRDLPGRPPRALLLLDGALGNYAIGAAPLIPAVTESVTDLAIGLTAGGKTAAGVSSSAARKAIERASNWVPRQPLSRVRCLTREAFEAAIPLARGDGLEAGMTLDVLHAGLLVSEVECEILHKPIRKAKRTTAQRLVRLRDVQMAIAARRARALLSTTTGAVVDRLPFGGTAPDGADQSADAAAGESVAPGESTLEAEPASSKKVPATKKRASSRTKKTLAPANASPKIKPAAPDKVATPKKAAPQAKRAPSKEPQ